MELFGIWIAAFLTLCIYSFLYRDNPFYRFAEHLFVGVSLGYSIVLSIHQAFYPTRVAAALGSGNRRIAQRLNQINSDWYRFVVFLRVVPPTDMADSVSECHPYRYRFRPLDSECAACKYFRADTRNRRTVRCCFCRGHSPVSESLRQSLWLLGYSVH